MLDSVRDYIRLYQLIQRGQPVLVGVSGGVDSMVLLHVMCQLPYDVHVAHVNYQLRGEESRADEFLVERYAAERSIPYQVLKVDPGIKDDSNGMSFQEKAREIRYAFFEKAAHKPGIGHVAVAHHLDDQAETVLLKLVKGSSMEGLAGMRPKRPISSGSEIQLIRPLLGQRREEILAYAAKENIPWREDASNASDTYQRNVIRNQILPLLKEHFGAAVPANLARSAAIFQGYWEESLRGELAKRLKQCCPTTDQIEVQALIEQPNVWRNRVLLECLYTWMPGRKVGNHMVEVLLDLVVAQVGRKMILPTGTVWRERAHLVFAHGSEEVQHEDEFLLPEIAEGGTLVFEGGKLDIFMQDEIPESLTVADPCVILADKNMLRKPFLVRRWMAGDRIIPFGMAGHKKVSDILTDAKIPSHQRASTYVLEADGQIVWVIGVRMADTIKITEKTEAAIRMVYHPG